MTDVCPDALFLNYTNPMGMLVRAVDEAVGLPTVGPVPLRLLDRRHAGRVPRACRRPRSTRCRPASTTWPGSSGSSTAGRDLYPDLAAFVEAGRVPDDDLVRADLFRRFGFYPTESSEHHAEYNPWFIPKGQVERVPRPDRRVPLAGRQQPRRVRGDEAPPRRRRAVRDRAQRRVRRGDRPRDDHRRAGPDRGQRHEPDRAGGARSSRTSPPTPASRCPALVDGLGRPPDRGRRRCRRSARPTRGRPSTARS